LIHHRTLIVLALASSAGCGPQSFQVAEVGLSRVGDAGYPLVASFRPEECWDASSRAAGDCLGGGGSKWSLDEHTFADVELVIPGSVVRKDGRPLASHLRDVSATPALERRSFGGIGCRVANTSSDNACGGVYPGHWLLEAGAVATSASAGALQAAGTSAGELEVTLSGDTSAFTGIEADRYLMIYARDPSGPQWATSEAAIVVSFDAGTGVLRLRRDTYLGRPMLDWASALGAGEEVVVAPHALLWNEAGLFGSLPFNLSPDSPVAPPRPSLSPGLFSASIGPDGTHAATMVGLPPGLNGWQAWVAYELSQIDLSETTGVQYDGGRWRPDQAPETFQHRVDANNDLIPDFGYADGVNVYGAGGALAMAALRDAAPDLSIVLDSSGWAYYRGYDHISGVEMENYAETPATYNGWWTGIGEAFLHLRNFVARQQEASPGGTSLHYAFTKHQTPTFQTGAACTNPLDACATDAVFRVGFVSDQLLGLPHPYASGSDSTGANYFDRYAWPEYYGGDASAQDWDWLGTPDGDWAQVPDLSSTVSALAGAVRVCTVSGSDSAVTCSGAGEERFPDGLASGSLALIDGDPVVTLSALPAPDPDGFSANTDARLGYTCAGGAACTYPNVGGTYLEFPFDTSASAAFKPKVTAGCTGSSPTCWENPSTVVSFTASGATDFDAAGLSSAEIGATGRPLWVTPIFEKSNGTYASAHSIALLIDATARTYTVDVPQNFTNGALKLAAVRFASGEEIGSFAVSDVTVSKGGSDRYYRTFSDASGAPTGAVFLNATPSDWDVSALLGASGVDVTPAYDAWVYRFDGSSWASVSSN
jgi:hypothetical protein